MDINPERRKDLARRIEVFWDGDGVYYRGTIIAFTAKSARHTVLYDDGELEKVDLDEVPHRWCDAGAPKDSQVGGAAPRGWGRLTAACVGFFHLYMHRKRKNVAQ